MRLIGIAIILTCLISSCEKGQDVHCSNQYIIAGASDNCFELIDIIPDSVISPISIYKSTNKSLKASHRSYAEMLLQSDDGFGKDGDYDFKFESEVSNALGGAYYKGVFLSNFNHYCPV